MDRTVLDEVLRSRTGQETNLKHETWQLTNNMSYEQLRQFDRWVEKRRTRWLLATGVGMLGYLALGIFLGWAFF